MPSIDEEPKSGDNVVVIFMFTPEDIKRGVHEFMDTEVGLVEVRIPQHLRVVNYGPAIDLEAQTVCRPETYTDYRRVAESMRQSDLPWGLPLSPNWWAQQRMLDATARKGVQKDRSPDYVETPAELVDGQTIRQKGKGKPGLNGGSPGDLIVMFRLSSV